MTYKQHLIVELMEQLLTGAVRMHRAIEEDTCPWCRRTGQEVAAMRARGVAHDCGGRQ